MTDKTLEVMVWGPLACFTRPEHKVERVSYEAMTPSAARGVLEAIFWKPQFRWQIHSIDVCAPLAWETIRRNEVKSVRSLEDFARGAAPGASFVNHYDTTTDRDQRLTLALRDVRYVIHADVVPLPGVGAPAAKWRAQFRRRVDRGQCFSQPFLGCREFACAFSEPTPGVKLIDWDADLGTMFWGFDHDKVPDAGGIPDHEHAPPLWFSAQVRGGRIAVPSLESVREEI